MKIKKGDMVKIINGKDSGKTGKVTEVFRIEDRLVVEGINIKKKHLRPKKQGQKGQIISISAPFHASNAMIICSSCGKASRIGIKIDGKNKIRICKKCENAL